MSCTTAVSALWQCEGCKICKFRRCKLQLHSAARVKFPCSKGCPGPSVQAPVRMCRAACGPTQPEGPPPGWIVKLLHRPACCWLPGQLAGQPAGYISAASALAAAPSPNPPLTPTHPHPPTHPPTTNIHTRTHTARCRVQQRSYLAAACPSLPWLAGWNACASCYGDASRSRKYLVLPGLKSGRVYGEPALLLLLLRLHHGKSMQC